MAGTPVAGGWAVVGRDRRRRCAAAKRNRKGHPHACTEAVDSHQNQTRPLRTLLRRALTRTMSPLHTPSLDICSSPYPQNSRKQKDLWDASAAQGVASRKERTMGAPQSWSHSPELPEAGATGAQKGCGWEGGLPAQIRARKNRMQDSRESAARLRRGARRQSCCSVAASGRATPGAARTAGGHKRPCPQRQ